MKLRSLFEWITLLLAIKCVCVCVITSNSIKYVFVHLWGISRLVLCSDFEIGKCYLSLIIIFIVLFDVQTTILLVTMQMLAWVVSICVSLLLGNDVFMYILSSIMIRLISCNRCKQCNVIWINIFAFLNECEHKMSIIPTGNGLYLEFSTQCVYHSET